MQPVNYLGGDSACRVAVEHVEGLGTECAAEVETVPSAHPGWLIPAPCQAYLCLKISTRTAVAAALSKALR